MFVRIYTNIKKIKNFFHFLMIFGDNNGRKTTYVKNKYELKIVHFQTDIRYFIVDFVLDRSIC